MDWLLIKRIFSFFSRLFTNLLNGWYINSKVKQNSHIKINHKILINCILKRFLVIYKPYLLKKITFRVSLITIISVCLLSLFWSILPFFGWSYYTLEKGLTSCSVEIINKSWNTKSFNITILIFCFLIPLIILFYCNIKIILIVSILINNHHQKNVFF